MTKHTSKHTNARRMMHAYLALVPVIGLLLVLLGQLVILSPDLVEGLGQVGLLRVHLHVDARVPDLLPQHLHLLGGSTQQHGVLAL